MRGLVLRWSLAASQSAQGHAVAVQPEGEGTHAGEQTEQRQSLGTTPLLNFRNINLQAGGEEQAWDVCCVSFQSQAEGLQRELGVCPPHMRRDSTGACFRTVNFQQPLAVALRPACTVPELIAVRTVFTCSGWGGKRRLGRGG